MNLNRYIVLSVIIHLSLFALLALMHPVRDTEAPVFEVDIIARLDVPDTPPTESVKPRLKKPARPEKPNVRPEPLDEELQPDVIEGGVGPPLRKSPPQSGSSGGSSADRPPHKEDSGEELIVGDSHDNTEQSVGKEGPATPLPPRKFLFDRETIERFARKPSEDDGALSFDSPGIRHRGYMRLLKQKIERIWEYPEEMARRGISGDLYLMFLIKRDGSLGEVRIVRTSGYRELDDAAIKALRDAEPFWPLPDDWEKDDFEIKGHFIYLPGGAYIL